MGNRPKKNNKSSFQSSQNNGQKTKTDMIEEIKQAQKEKVNAALITDERVAAKLEEFDKAKSNLEEEYKKMEETLQKDIDRQQKELDERAKILDKQKKQQDELAFY